MLLKTKRLTIRPIRAEDWPHIKAIWQDFQHSAYAQYDRPNSTADADVRSRIARWAEMHDGAAHLFFAVCLDNAPIGYAVFHRRKNGYETGYCFHSAFHGNGYAKESLLCLFDHLRSLGASRILAGTALANTPSVALLKSLGFCLTGTEQVTFYRDADGNDLFFEGGIFERKME